MKRKSLDRLTLHGSHIAAFLRRRAVYLMAFAVVGVVAYEDAFVGSSFNSSTELMLVTGGDVDFQFTNNKEGFQVSSDIKENALTPDGIFLIRAAPNSNPFIYKNGLSFSGSFTTKIRVRMMAKESGLVRLCWGTTEAGGFSEARSRTVSYSTAKVFRELVFDMSEESAWVGKIITDLRIETTSGSNDAHTWFDHIVGEGRSRFGLITF